MRGRDTGSGPRSCSAADPVSEVAIDFDQAVALIADERLVLDPADESLDPADRRPPGEHKPDGSAPVPGDS